MYILRQWCNSGSRPDVNIIENALNMWKHTVSKGSHNHIKIEDNHDQILMNQDDESYTSNSAAEDLPGDLEQSNSGSDTSFDLSPDFFDKINKLD